LGPMAYGKTSGTRRARAFALRRSTNSSGASLKNYVRVLGLVGPEKDNPEKVGCSTGSAYPKFEKLRYFALSVKPMRLRPTAPSLPGRRKNKSKKLPAKGRIKPGLATAPGCHFIVYHWGITSFFRLVKLRKIPYIESRLALPSWIRGIECVKLFRRERQ
jgi:hypothetical protein